PQLLRNLVAADLHMRRIGRIPEHLPDGQPRRTGSMDPLAERLRLGEDRTVSHAGKIPRSDAPKWQRRSARHTKGSAAHPDREAVHAGTAPNPPSPRSATAARESAGS